MTVAGRWHIIGGSDMRSHAKVFVILGALLLLGTAVPATAQFVNGQPAVGVLGANDLVTRPDAAITASTLGGPNGVDIDPLTGKVFVVDRTYHRVLRWTSMDALNNGSAAEAVIGQADFTSGASGLADLKDPRAFGALLQLSRESDEGARVAACKALAALGVNVTVNQRSNGEWEAHVEADDGSVASAMARSGAIQ